MSWITEVRYFVAASYVKVAVLIFFSCLLFMHPGLFSILGWEQHYYAVINKYDAQITVGLGVSAVLIFGWIVTGLWTEFDRKILDRCEWWRNRRPRIRLVKASYGVGLSYNIVNDKVKAIIKDQGNNQVIRFQADDPYLLSKGKVDDPMKGSPKMFKIVYWCRFEQEYEQGQEVRIPCGKLVPAKKSTSNNS